MAERNVMAESRVKRRTGVWPVAVRRAFHGMPCVICGSNFKTCIDHKTPLAAGGSNDFSNLQVLCEPCNLKKGARLTDEQMRDWYLSNKDEIDADRRHREANRFNMDSF